jgi:hypothetical protein
LGDTFWYLHMCLHYILDSPLPLFPSSPIPPILEQFQRFRTSVFINKYTIHLPYSPLFTLSLCPPLPLVPIPSKDLFYPPVLHFFWMYVDGPRGFCLGTSGLYILCVNQINPPQYSTAYSTVVHYIIFIYRLVVSIFSIL